MKFSHLLAIFGSLNLIFAADPTFESGFEAGTTPTGSPSATDLIGTDIYSGFDWVRDLEQGSQIGKFSLQYTGGTPAQRAAEILVEPGPSSNRVLEFRVSEPNASNGNGRVQANLYGNSLVREYYQSVRMWLHPDFAALSQLSKDFTFFTIAEFWNNNNWTGNPHPFRISLNLSKRSGLNQDLYFFVHAQTDMGRHWREEWGQQNTDFSVPIGQWFTADLYLREGFGQGGRFFFAVTPEGGERQVIFDIYETTHSLSDSQPDGFSELNPMKLYTSPDLINFMQTRGKSFILRWDDFSLYLDGPPASLPTSPSSDQTSSSYPIKDALLRSGSPNDADGLRTSMELREQPNDRDLFFLQFDTKNLEGREIEEAILEIPVYERGGPNTVDVEIHPIVGDWDEYAITYATRNAFHPVTPISLTIGEPDQYEVDVTKFVRQANARGDDFLGFALKSITPFGGPDWDQWLRIRTREAAANPPFPKHPRLTTKSKLTKYEQYYTSLTPSSLWTDQNLRSPSADYDQDGLSNASEFILGRNLTKPDRHENDFQVFSDPFSNHALEIQFRKNNVLELSDLIFESSTDLKTWTPVSHQNLAVTPDPHSDHDFVTHIFPISPSTPDLRTFFRVSLAP